MAAAIASIFRYEAMYTGSGVSGRKPGARITINFHNSSFKIFA